jgi:hypothetical protein
MLGLHQSANSACHFQPVYLLGVGFLDVRIVFVGVLEVMAEVS